MILKMLERWGSKVLLFLLYGTKYSHELSLRIFPKWSHYTSVLKFNFMYHHYVLLLLMMGIFWELETSL